MGGCSRRAAASVQYIRYVDILYVVCRMYPSCLLGIEKERCAGATEREECDDVMM